MYATIVEVEQSAEPLPALDRRIAVGRIASAARPAGAAGCRHLGGPLAVVAERDLRASTGHREFQKRGPSSVMKPRTNADAQAMEGVMRDLRRARRSVATPLG